MNGLFRLALLIALLATVVAVAIPERSPAVGPDPARRAGGEADPMSGATTTLPCPTGGYLCANVDRTASIRVRRWTAPVTTLVVHVPAPDFEPPTEAARLQSAAAAGIRAWNGQPFPVRVETRATEDAHFVVRWVRTLGGDAVGIARTRWSTDSGLAVTSVDLEGDVMYPRNTASSLTARDYRSMESLYALPNGARLAP